MFSRSGGKPGEVARDEVWKEKCLTSDSAEFG